MPPPLALAAEWEQKASEGWPKDDLMGYELHEFNVEHRACRSHAAELREALGAKA